MKKISTLLLIIAILASGVAIISNVQAATNVSGDIITDTTWTAAESPYIFTVPVVVNEGVKLTIEPGVTVNIGAYYLQINGTLQAKGTSSSSILFSSEGTTYATQINFTPTSLDWNETAGTGCIIVNSELTASIAINDASPKINANKISDNTASTTDTNIVISVNGGSAIISNNRLNGAVEVKNGGSPKISGNTITGGMNLYQGAPEISDNDISGGTGNDVISITHESAATITGNSITGKSIGVAFNMHNNGYSNNAYSATIQNNTIKNCPTGIGIGEGQGTILLSGNRIFGSSIGIKVANVSVTINIELNLIMNNTHGIDIGAQIAVQKNTIYNNTIGIYYETTAASVISYNNIMNNTEYNLKLTNSSPSTLDATYNYWGTQDVPTINQTIYDANDNSTLGEVVYLPALSQPNSDAPTIAGIDMTPTPTPTPSVTPTATPTATPYQTPSHTATPTATPPVTEAGLSGIEIAVIAALIIVVVIAVILVLKKNGKSRQNPIP